MDLIHVSDINVDVDREYLKQKSCEQMWLHPGYARYHERQEPYFLLEHYFYIFSQI